AAERCVIARWESMRTGRKRREEKSMNDIEVIQRQLDRVLGFFPRVEARINGLFGVNTLILAIGALNVSASDLKLWFVTVPGFFALAGLVASYAFLYRANFPDVKGGQGSLVY